MTIQVRSKRRILPKRSVVDVDFVSPTTHNLQDLLQTSIPSKKDYSVINQLFGGEERARELPQVVVGRPRDRAREDVLSSFFGHHSILPLAAKAKITCAKREPEAKSFEKREDRQGALDDAKMPKETTSERREGPLEPVILIERSARQKKSRDKKRPEVSLMVPPGKLPRRPRIHGTIQMLKTSGALHWVVNGRDRDPRKRDVGQVRKRQLQTRLRRRLVHQKSHPQGIWEMKQEPMGS